jgi:histidine ammonia-lyase/tyrosine ammonia-lyase
MAEGHEQGKPHPGQDRQRGEPAPPDRGLAARAVAREPGHGYARRLEGRQGRHQVFMQKAYSLRCIPQILGAVRDTLEFCAGVVERELNSSNDNPLFFGGEGGLSRRQLPRPARRRSPWTTSRSPATQVGVLSERRLNRLLNPHLNRALPEFLVAKNPGLRCGFAGAQYPRRRWSRRIARSAIRRASRACRRTATTRTW